MTTCPRCNAENAIVNQCRCDPHNLPTRPGPAKGVPVSWHSPFDGWRSGTYVGLAPGDNGQGDPFVTVDSHNGRVHVRLSALAY